MKPKKIKKQTSVMAIASTLDSRRPSLDSRAFILWLAH